MLFADAFVVGFRFAGSCIRRPDVDDGFGSVEGDSIGRFASAFGLFEHLRDFGLDGVARLVEALRTTRFIRTGLRTVFIIFISMDRFHFQFGICNFVTKRMDCVSSII